MPQTASAAFRRRRRCGDLVSVLLLLVLARFCVCTDAKTHVALVRRQHLPRRSSPQALADWAAAEIQKIRNRYDPQSSTLPSVSTLLLRARQQGDADPVGAASSRSASLAASSANAQLLSVVASASASAYKTVGQIQMTNYQSDLEYYAQLEIGTPRHAYNVILDTGSADLWLASYNCSTAQCGAVPRINPTNSSTASNLATPFSIRYGVGAASGMLYADNMTLAHRNLSSQTYAVCDQVTTTLLSGNVSGLMGLGFQPLAASGLKPLWQNLLDADVGANTTSLTFPGFAFALTRFVNVTGASLNEFGGIFSIGTLSNASYTGNISFIEIPSNLQSYWLIPLDAVVFNGTDLPNVGTPNAAIDTGTTLIGGPQAVIQDLYSRIPGAVPASGQYQGYYTFPCNASNSIGLTFGGNTYNITPADFNLGTFTSATTTSPAMCLGAFFDLVLSAGSSSVISWVVGDAFLKNVYSAYRYLPTPAVGFASLSPSFLSISPSNPLIPTNSSHASRAAASTLGIFPSVSGGPISMPATSVQEARGQAPSASLSFATSPASRSLPYSIPLGTIAFALTIGFFYAD